MTTLWLTRVMPDLRNRQARADLASAVNLHHRVMKLYPDGIGDQARKQLGVLFRSEDGPRGPQLLIQSRVRPDLGKLPTNYGTAETKPLTPLLEALRPGLFVRYRIAANAIRKPGKTTRALYHLNSVIPLTGTAAEEWWIRQAENGGLKIHSVHSTPLDTARGTSTRGRQPDARTRQTVVHARTRFEGTALIQDADLLRQRLADGIGKGKAYGCGLLTLAPTQHLS
ncbi:type I-E CRISPR-associated protein Cas6/Cse3/CasE [Streptomyces thermoviolaceus]|jgi:CRISPR system Cascade subunit CasE|uniref:type I-E CRISPR-associated protein Cas6/Cse3/CasE n=1 Tax=Streptomyces thermoviolaceus TaxID=1952 RepID=UPI00203E66DC|nr:type I-E CRISPR-associated protein Cas6/Cse3/CasE [Streptomyces thermoviolaceus]MCM3266843.1 type I-E CRISPR-associated protein Cas6/Cse3/CasE [Streptomyces thermoviolaceus]